jgi:hypothetical protein
VCVYSKVASLSLVLFGLLQLTLQRTQTQAPN